MQIGTSASLGHDYCKLLLAMKDQLWRSGSQRSGLHKAQRGLLMLTKRVREKWPKTVYCKLHICIHIGK